MKNGTVNRNKIIVWFILFIFTFVTERVFFQLPINYGNKLYIAAKIICGGLLYMLVSFVIRVACLLRDRDERTIAITKYSFIVFLFYFILLILIWPGNWYGDAMNVLHYARHLEVVWLQGLAASLWAIVWLMIVPIPTILTVVNMAGTSILCGILLYMLQEKIHNKKIFVLAWLFPLNPCMVYLFFYSHRSIDVAVLEALITVVLIYKIWYKKSLDNFETFVISIAIGIFPCMRTETLLISVALISVCIVSKYLLNTFQKYMIVIVPVMVLLINNVASWEHRTTYDMAYMYNPLPYLLQEEELRGRNINQDLEKLDKVFDIEEIKTWSLSYVQVWCWVLENDGFRENFTEEEFSEAKMAFWDLVLNNFDKFIEVRWNCFKATMGIDKEDGLLYLLRPHHEFWGDYENLNMSGVKLFTPINEALRLRILNILMFCDKDYNRVFEIPYRFFYNGIPACAAIIASAVFSLIKRNKEIFFINGGYVALGIALFLLVPEAQIMYYASILIYGNSILYYCLFKGIEKGIFYLSKCKVQQ